MVGGSRGVGAWIGRRLAGAEWRVTAVGSRPAVEADIGAQVEYLRIDLSTLEGIAALTDHLHRTEPDLVVWNATMYGDRANTVPLPDIERLFRVNCLSAYSVLVEFLSERSNESFCSCIVINSDSIFHANMHSAVYGASKAALRVLTAGLAHRCSARNASVATLLLGPIGDDRAHTQFADVASRQGVALDAVVTSFLKKSNPAFVISELIGLDACADAVFFIAGLGRSANGMMCRLDGGSAGSLV